MLKRSMELNADLQEENAAMMEERSSLQGPSESSYKKNRHRQTGLNHRQWEKKLVVKVLSAFRKRP